MFLFLLALTALVLPAAGLMLQTLWAGSEKQTEIVELTGQNYPVLSQFR